MSRPLEDHAATVLARSRGRGSQAATDWATIADLAMKIAGLIRDCMAARDGTSQPAELRNRARAARRPILGFLARRSLARRHGFVDGDLSALLDLGGDADLSTIRAAMDDAKSYGA